MTELELIEACRQAFLNGDNIARAAIADHLEDKGRLQLAAEVRSGELPRPQRLQWNLSVQGAAGGEGRYTVSVDVDPFLFACFRRAKAYPKFSRIGEADLMFGSVKIRPAADSPKDPGKMTF